MPYCPTILLPVMTTVSEEVPQGEPTLVRTHAPLKLPPPLPPPPLFRDARRGSSASGLLRRAGFDGSAERGVSREPDNDFSSLPMLPPALPDCAHASPGKATTASMADSAAAFSRYRIIFCIICWFPMRRVQASGPSASSPRWCSKDSPVWPHSSIAATFALPNRLALAKADIFKVDGYAAFKARAICVFDGNGFTMTASLCGFGALPCDGAFRNDGAVSSRGCDGIRRFRSTLPGSD